MLAHNAARRPLAFAVLCACLGALLVTGFPARGSAQIPVRPLTRPAKPTVASVTSKLNGLARTAERLAEGYNKAVIDVTAARGKAATARHRASLAKAQYTVAHRQFVLTVRAQYESGSLSATDALLGSRNQQDYLNQLSTMDLASRQQGANLRAVGIAARSVAAANVRAANLLTAAHRRMTVAGARRLAVQHQINRFRSVLAGLTAAQQRAYSKQNSATPQQAASAVSVRAGSAAAQRAVQFALAQVGKPYVFGAAGPGAYDCSGLTMAAWSQGGVSIPHLASAQYNYGKHVGANQLQPGDLVFLYNPIGHVSMYIGNGMLVSAPQPGESVKIVPFAYFRSDFTGATRLA